MNDDLILELGERREVNVTEEMRQELLLIVDAIEADDLMTPGLRDVREAASTPIT